MDRTSDGGGFGNGSPYGSTSRTARSRSGGTIYLGRLLELPASGRFARKARPGATASRNPNRRAQRTRRLLEPHRLGGPLFLARFQRTARAVRPPLPYAGALHTTDGSGWPKRICRQRCASRRVGDPLGL